MVPQPENPLGRVIRHQREKARGDVELYRIENIPHLTSWWQSGGEIEVAGEPYTAAEFGQIDIVTMSEHLSAGRLFEIRRLREAAVE